VLINPESESLLLSAFIKFPQEAGSQCVEANLTSETFHSIENSALYRFLLGTWSTGEKLAQHLIVFDLKKQGLMDSVGGIERVQALLTLCPSLELVPRLIGELKELKQRRILMQTAKEVYERAQDGTATQELASLMSRASATEVSSELKFPSPKELSQELIAHAESMNLIPTGFKAIDRECGSLYPGDFLVIGGGAKAGKSTLASNIATNIAGLKFVVIFTIEMNRVEFWRRVVNAKAGVSQHYWHPDVAQSDWNTGKVLRAMESLNTHRMTIVDQVQCIDQAFSVARALKAKHGELGAVVIDYLQMFSTPEKTSTRAEAVSAISRACKRGATALQTLVIGCSQLNDDGKSLESRGIQRDSNLMLNVAMDDHGNRSVVCAFNRNGPMGMVLPLTAELQFNRFVDSEL